MKLYAMNYKFRILSSVFLRTAAYVQFNWDDSELCWWRAMISCTGLHQFYFSSMLKRWGSKMVSKSLLCKIFWNNASTAQGWKCFELHMTKMGYKPWKRSPFSFWRLLLQQNRSMGVVWPCIFFRNMVCASHSQVKQLLHLPFRKATVASLSMLC